MVDQVTGKTVLMASNDLPPQKTAVPGKSFDEVLTAAVQPVKEQDEKANSVTKGINSVQEYMCQLKEISSAQY